MARLCLSLPSISNALILCVVLAVFLLFLDFTKRRKKWANYPPGPYCIPFLGNMLQVDFQNPVTSFDKFHKRYGDVYSLQFCWTNVVVLNGFEVMKETLLLKPDNISDRPKFPIFDDMEAKEKCEVTNGKVPADTDPNQV